MNAVRFRPCAEVPMRVEAMQTLQFPCPHCHSLMAVGLNLLGRNVRCPHCKQVVQAPASNPSEIETPRPAPAPDLAPVPVFQIPAPPKETHESIFGENHSDDLFEGATRTPKVIMPDAPSPTSRLEVIPPPPPREPETIVELPNPVVPASPFDFARPEPLRPPVIVPPPAHEPDPEPLSFAANQAKDSGGLRPPLAPETSAAPQSSSTLLMIVLGYAGLVTAVAAYLFFTSKTAPKGGEADPHWAVPDLFGEYDKAERKKVSASFFPPELGKLPPQLVTGLRKPVRVGDLEVEPLSVRFETPRAFERSEAGDAKPLALKTKVLTLDLRLTNRSADTLFHPNDPAFQRRTAADHALNAIEVGDKAEFGGLFFWPQQARRYVAGQEDDPKPLPPGGSRVTVVTSAGPAPYEWLKAGGKGLWRVQLRRGLVKAGDREISATTVVGVEFSAADVKAGS